MESEKISSFCVEISELVNKHLAKEANTAEMAAFLITHACIMCRVCNGEDAWIEKMLSMVCKCIVTTSTLDMDQICKFREV